MSNIGSIILEKGKDVAIQITPSLISIYDELNIDSFTNELNDLSTEAAGEAKNVCPTADRLKQLEELRNNLVNKLNSAAKIIESLSKLTNVLTPVLNTTETSLITTKLAVIATKIAITAVPPTIPIPGQLIVGLNVADNLVNNILPPVISQTSNKINSITTATDFTNNALLKILGILSLIDTKLKFCGAGNLTPLNGDLIFLNGDKNLPPSNGDGNLTSLNGYLDSIFNTPQSQDTPPNIYKGFILEIIEEPFSPTVNRRKAIAKNNQGIILLSTPLSFTTESQLLINEIKILIDSNNLKAD